MANNKLSDLNNHLFAQLERLGEEDLQPEQLKQEMERAKSINGIAKNIIDNARTTLEVIKFTYSEMPANQELPDQLKLKENN